MGKKETKMQKKILYAQREKQKKWKNSMKSHFAYDKVRQTSGYVWM